MNTTDVELVNLYHLARTALSGKDDSRWARMVWASKWHSKEHPEITESQSYKRLEALLAPEEVDHNGNRIQESRK